MALDRRILFTRVLSFMGCAVFQERDLLAWGETKQAKGKSPRLPGLALIAAGYGEIGESPRGDSRKMAMIG